MRVGRLRRRYVVLFFVALLLAASLAYTWPLVLHLGKEIPCACNSDPVLTRQLVPGDHLQFYYWCWLMRDNLMGSSQMFSNPYEFSTYLHAENKNYALFPFSLLWVALSPLGGAAAYNILFLLSYILAGLFAYALARQMLDSRWAAVWVGLCYALLPSRAKWAYGGHLYGFVSFMLPAVLWCVERGLARSSLWWGALAGVALMVAALMEPHLTYYLSLLLGVYLPLRFILAGRMDDTLGDAQGLIRPLCQLLAVIGGGAALGLFMYLQRVLGSSLGVEAAPLLRQMALYAGLLVPSWLLLSWLIAGWAGVEFPQSRSLVSRALLPLYALSLYSLRLKLGIPFLGSVLLALSLAGFVLLLAAPLWRLGPRPRLAREGLWAFAVVVLGLAAATAWELIFVRGHAILHSLAHGGRTMEQVMQSSHSLAELFDTGNAGLMRLWIGRVLMAWGGVAALCLALGRPAGKRRGAAAALALALGLFFLVLGLGPKVEELPLYRWLFKYLPFFNYPNLPQRLIMFGSLFLAIAGGWALTALARLLPRPGLGLPILTLAAAAAVMWEYWPSCHPALSVLEAPPALVRAIKANMPTGPHAKGRVLFLPIFRGDDHRSSVFELVAVSTRVRMVNGYSPLTPASYADRIYTPLTDLNMGEFSLRARRELRRLEVEGLCLYEQGDLFDYRVSYFPAELTRRRMLASGQIKPLAHAGNWFLFRHDPGAPLRPVNYVTSAATLSMEAEKLSRDTGRLGRDPMASGYGRATIVTAEAGRDGPGFILDGPGRPLPLGRYLARFRLRRGPGGRPGKADIIRCDGGLVAELPLTPQVLPPDGRWHDVLLPFESSAATPLRFRVYFSGLSDLDADVVLLNFAGRERPEPFYSASELWRETGELAPDARTLGGLAVAARPESHGCGLLMYGPNVTLPPGNYRAGFRLARLGPCTKTERVLRLLICARQDKMPLDPGGASRNPVKEVLGRDLPADGSYRQVSMDFRVPALAEIDLRVWYCGHGAIQLAGVTLEKVARGTETLTGHK